VEGEEEEEEEEEEKSKRKRRKEAERGGRNRIASPSLEFKSHAKHNQALLLTFIASSPSRTAILMHS
jgi:hypothetical protein